MLEGSAIDSENSLPENLNNRCYKISCYH